MHSCAHRHKHSDTEILRRRNYLGEKQVTSKVEVLSKHSYLNRFSCAVYQNTFDKTTIVIFCQGEETSGGIR